MTVAGPLAAILTASMSEHLLITGGAGFIGSHLAERWLAEGGRVTVLDDLSTGSIANLRAAGRSARFRLEQGSVLDRRRVRRLVEQVDSVAHLAAVVGVERVCERTLETWQVHVEGSRAVLEAAAELGRPVLLASSSEVYGADPPVPVSESHPLGFGAPEAARWTYAASKSAMESLGLALARETGLPVRTVRFFNTSGARQSPGSGMVLPRLVEAALAGRPLQVHGDGRQTRSFCHVLDAVETLVRLLRERDAVGRVFNVGNDREISIDGLAQLVIERTGSSSEIVHVPYPAAIVGSDVRRRVPDLARLESCIGFRPRRSVGEIVEHVAASLDGRGVAR